MAQFVVDRRRSRTSWLQLLVHLDVVLLGAVLGLTLLGVLMVYAATKAQFGHYYLEHQLIWVVIGLCVMAAVMLVDYRHWEVPGYVAYGLILLGLLAVHVVGRSAQGAARWIPIGPFQFQPSAFATLGLILAVAAYVHRHQEAGLTIKRVLALLVMAGLSIGLVVKEPDLGSAIVMLVTFGALLVVAGTRVRYLVILAVLGVIGGLVVFKLGLLHSYQAGRITAFLHPHTTAPSAQPTLYTLKQAKIAIGSGGLHGQGLFKASQTNLGYVPNQYTDYIFTAVGEELGFVGAATMLCLFTLVVWRLLRAAQVARDQYGRLLCAGVLILIAFSVFESVGMTVGLMPMTGIPLPFLSYGGSAMIALFAGIGLALNVGMRRHVT